MSSQICLGQASFLQARNQTLLEAEASVDFFFDTTHPDSSGPHLLDFLNSEVWSGAKSCFIVSLDISVDKKLLPSSHSQRSFLRQLVHALSEAELWSQLQLRADVDLAPDHDDTSVQQGFTLNIELRRRDLKICRSLDNRSHDARFVHDVENLRPPSSIPTAVLNAVNISLSFSHFGTTSSLPQKRSRSGSEGFIDLLNDTPCAQKLHCAIKSKAPSIVTGREQQNHDPNGTTKLDPEYASSEEDFLDIIGGAFDAETEDTNSPIFSSQGSTVISVPRTCPQILAEGDCTTTSEHSSMTSLIDAALRSIVCPNPIRMAPGIQTETSGLESRLSDLCPSVFSHGYATAVAARAPLVPTVARFLTSFLQKSRNIAVLGKKKDLVTESSSMDEAYNSGNASQQVEDIEKLKEVVKTNVWMTLTNGSRNTESARRLKPLQISTAHINRPSDNFLDIESALPEGAGVETGEGLFVRGESHGAEVAGTSNEDGILGFGEDEERDITNFDILDTHEDCLSAKREEFCHKISVSSMSRLRNISSPTPVSSLLTAGLQPMERESLSTVPEHDSYSSTPGMNGKGGTSPRNLLDDEASTLRLHRRHDDQSSKSELKIATSPSVLLLQQEEYQQDRGAKAKKEIEQDDDDDDEPAFQQWEFDVEQGYEYNDAETLFY